VAYLRKKLGITAKECAEYLGLKSFTDIQYYEADPARVKSAKPMPATHCALLVMIVEYHDKFKRLPPLEYLKEVNLDQKGRFMVLECPAWGTTGNSEPENLPSAREIKAFQRQEAAKKAKKD